jgi:hypothetical protein
MSFVYVVFIHIDESKRILTTLILHLQMHYYITGVTINKNKIISELCSQT